MKNRKIANSIVWAVALILTGFVILLSSLDVITIKENIYFFVAIAIISVVFHVACFINKPKRYNLLVPGGMLLMCSALFIATEYSTKLSIDELWPVIILAVAFGMLEQKVFSKGVQGNWSSIIIISVIGFFFLIQRNLGFGIAIGALLIIFGVLIVVRLIKQTSKTAEAPAESTNETVTETQPEVDEFEEM